MRQNKLIRIGVTGGMGAGKSTVAGYLEEAGLLVIDADMVSRDVMELYPEVHDYIRKTYGEEYFLPNGDLDRRRFGRRVFPDPQALAEYEAVIMPFIVGEIKERFDYIDDATEDEYAVLDAPLLFAVRDFDVFDISITVEMPRELQIERAMERDSLTRTEVEDRLNRQMSREQREALADYVIINDGSLEELKDKTLAVFELIKQRGMNGR
ncbi:dephospho-CoA kinase [Proteiniclasticum sp. QWL-01]|uniref:dephospho-CoA kinase n=1 Tax=Proteiniclasticum sp. QWL-01 TaxID=3036945 RepID=UPI00220E2485|nr:dephospho-CoA kinase [Proteiniclasticum sp. QWL-01]UUM10634.1 dephospho-CoA kinase [Clostridiaceae bacterium HFYG-1003]WFF71968.1 dephospho-CoA kinase [Proteiniclasticum sp. QWL-01]